ncbi:MAG: chorismate synthase [Candidatus Alkaliphilus sp. MAG34]|nr:chorismate synthase [Clostridiales bacterium]
MLRYLTAGESHGKYLSGIIEGFPSNVPIDVDKINADLKRRQMGYGRGDRMKIEQDRIEILSGVRNSKTLGSPIAFLIQNRDYKNWEKYMDPIKIEDNSRKVTRPRPGHADLCGAVKYNFADIRNVLERSSARETAVRVAIGSIVKQLTDYFYIDVMSHVTAIGNVSLEKNIWDVEKIKDADKSPVRCINKNTEDKMINEIEKAKKAGDSLGGAFEIHITGVPIGLGSYVHWDRKLDAKLAYSLMSIQGIKAVEIGEGFGSSRLKGSEMHDEIFYNPKKGYHRETNRAGGIEGGMSNGENIVIRCYMKPIPTLHKPLQSIDIETKESFIATVERSDTCAVPSASVVGEMVAITVIADEFLRKYGGDSLEEITKRWKE